MPAITTRDGTELHYRDWGSGPTVVFSHGWPLTGDAFEDQMFFLASRGYRCIAHDRRGHGRSGKPWAGNDMDTYADDLAALMNALDLKDVVLVGHSTGGGEVTRYVGRHGTARVAKIVLISAVPPGLLQSDANPRGVPKAELDKLRAALLTDRAQFFRDFSVPFFGTDRPGAKVSQGVLDAFWLQSITTSLPAAYACIAAFSESDFRDDLERFDVPTLILHGEDDQVVPLEATGRRTAKLVKGAVLKTFPGLPHGLCSTHKDLIDAELLAFLKQPTAPPQPVTA